MRTAYRILRDGAQMLREHCAPVETWTELDRLADELENGRNPFPPVPHHEDELPRLTVGETSDD